MEVEFSGFAGTEEGKKEKKKTRDGRGQIIVARDHKIYCTRLVRLLGH